MTRTLRLLIGALAAGAVLAPHTAKAEVELGGFVGAHIFNKNNELGRFDDGPDDLAPQHMAMLGLRLSYLPIPRLGFEGEVAVVPTFTRGAGNPQTPVLAYRGSILFNILTGRVRPFILAGGGAMTMFSTNQGVVTTDTDPALHAGAGLRIDIGKNWGFRLDGRVLFPPSTGESVFTVDGEVLVGFYGRLGMGSAALADEDQDGIADINDKCPKDAEDRDGFKDADGCPEPDNDGDGVPDETDRCSNEAGISDQGGCPNPDTDGDGLLDREDKCPQVAGAPANGGCPDVDTDGDGLYDRVDKCPNEPETRNYFQDEDGCPDELPQSVKKFTGVIPGINFELNKDTITKDSYDVLDEAVKVLIEHSGIKMEIAGHTDTSGNADYNRQLSQRRADAVREYFIHKGIEGSRIKAMGFGADRPLSPNDTPAGRKKNRRVEFNLID